MTRVHDSGTTGPPPAGSAVSRPGGHGMAESWTRAGRVVLRAAAAVRWYVTSLMGDNAYGTYLAHQRRTHPDVEPLTERQFWRQRMDDQDRNPGARCC